MEVFMDYKQMTTPCGLNCANCEIYLSYNGKDPRKIKPVFILLKPFFGIMAIFSKKSRTRLSILNRILRIPKDKPICRGCRNENGKVPILASTETCKVFKCTKEKGIHNCSECDDFPCENLYPSSFLADIAPHNTKITNCCLIRKYGLEKWVKEHSKKVTESYFKGDFPVDI